MQGYMVFKFIVIKYKYLPIKVKKQSTNIVNGPKDKVSFIADIHSSVS